MGSQERTGQEEARNITLVQMCSGLLIRVK